MSKEKIIRGGVALYYEKAFCSCSSTRDYDYRNSKYITFRIDDLGIRLILVDK